MESIFQTDLLELQNVFAKISSVQISAVIDAIIGHVRVFTYGRGRSGLVMNMFAMRLMQLGLDAHAIGEPTAPAVNPGDVVIISSGSGRTDECILAAQKASALKAVVVVLSAANDTPLAESANMLVIIPAVSKHQEAGEKRVMLAGTIFEQSLLIFCDCVCEALAQRIGKTTSDLMSLHANIE